MESPASVTGASRGLSITFVFTLLCTLFCNHVSALGATDTITWGGDNSRTGYQENHKMDPSVVGSAQFGQLFKTLLPGTYNGAAEQIFSQPLVYTTTSDNTQYVYVATTQNNLYKLNAKTGAIVQQRNLHIPFLTADLDGCTDINPLVGVTATGVIDPATETLYLTSKTYVNQDGGNGAQGKPNGRYYLHAINVNDLTERPNFPVDLEGTVARNNPSRSFGAGIHLQRPALLHTGNFIYAGFASHCVQYNFTGWVMGWDMTTGANVERFSMEGAPVPNTTPGGGIWMSGGGISSDDRGSIFFGTGNGYSSQLDIVPVNGRNPPSGLEEAAVHMTINGDGSLNVADFFMPWEKRQLDGADRDLGTTPLEILPDQFSCGNYKRIGVITGKSGKTYFLNLDDLGGYRNGPNNLDNIIGVYQNENSVYSGAGVYPLEGGYIYINVIQYPTHVFKFSCDGTTPSFTKMADSPSNNAYVLGTGHGTVTTLDGQAGTGLLWTTDVAGYNLRIYDAVPVRGLLTQINQFNIPGVTKFSRPVFGDGRAYVGTNQGYIYGFGSPVNSPMNCSTPYDFGVSNLNTQTTAKTVTCTANIATTITNVTLAAANFVISNVPAIPATIAAGGMFSFQAAFLPTSVGSQSSDVVIDTTNGVAGYSVMTPVSLRGTGQSVNALLSVSPPTLAFQGAISGAQVGGVNQSVMFTNQGNSPLTISEIKYSLVSESGPFVAPNVTSSGPKAKAFTFINLPSTIPGNSQVVVTVNFDTTNSGNFGAYLNVLSDGGTKIFNVVGTAGGAPMALVEFQTTDRAGWVPFQSGKNFTFGNVTEQQTRTLRMRITNNGTSSSSRLSLTVSKPPFGVDGIVGASNSVDLTEGTSLAPGENATAALFCSVPKSQWNTDPYVGGAVWTINMDDPNFGKQVIQFDCTAVSEQGGTLQPNGLGYYRYTGCFKENNPGRQLKRQIYSSINNTNDMCLAACSASGNTFCGNQYNRECWTGPNIPVQKVDDANCNFPCTGDVNQICGGNGITKDGSFLSLFADMRYFDGNTSTAPPTGPFVNPGVGGFTSMGCYTEPTGGRALQQQLTPKTKTVANCVAVCDAASYTYAGLEYGGECWCGKTLNSNSLSVAASDCSTTCNDNATEYCGAGGRLNIYQKSGIAPTTLSSTSSTVSSTTTSGTSTSSASSSTTSSMITSGTTTSGSTSSVTTSTASPTGPAIRQLVGNYAFQGCYSEQTTGGRALSSKAYANNSMTLEMCSTFCTGLKYWGVEYGRECYCGSALGSGSTLVADQNDCNFLCPGDKSTYCGAGNRIQLYMLAGAASTSTTSSTSSTSSRSSTSTSRSGTSQTSSTTSQTSDSSTSSGTSQTSSATSGTSQTSSSTSQTSGSSTGSGTSQTSSTTSQSSSSSTSSGPSQTSITTSGTSQTSSTTSQTSGSSTSSGPSQTSSTSSQSSSSSTSSSETLTTSSSTSVSTTSTSTSATPTGPTIVPSTGPYNYMGCYTEATSGRALAAAFFPNNTNTIATCAASCSAYTYFGMEYGRECWCGNSFGVGSVQTKDSDCSMTCGGDKFSYCGAGNRLSVYIKNGTVGAGSSSSSSATSTTSMFFSTSSSLSSTTSSSSRISSSGTSSSASSTSTSSSSSGSSLSSSSTSASSTSISSSSATSSSSTSTTSSSSSITSTTSAKPTPTGPVISSGNANFTYYSCVSEPPTGRLLPSQILNNGTAMTIELCLSTCYNYAYAGVEYGRECWCGNSLNTANYGTQALNVSDSQCNFQCPGNSTEYCGAGGRMSLYWFDSVKAAMTL
ncbi:WSC domain-containing protein [Amylocarpus encephaloides]|uniref:WSC domain-containing protein n=1 Tax=Amylocarpus encephaloides TaxID=45428 RepID=A0A9P8C1L5_9HELO|nr:WSC domain-containing protein [Amylocarpus encephaloides]